MADDDKDKKREIMIKLQLIEQHVQNITHQMQTIDTQHGDLETAQSALEGLGHGAAQALVQISGGIFVPATINDFSKLIVNVGANTMVEKQSSDVLGQIKEQLQALMHIKTELELQKNRLLEQAKKLHEEFEGKNS